MEFAWPPRLVLAVILGFAAGCANVGYIFNQAVGQIDILWSSRSIDDVLQNGALNAEQARKLRLIVEAREFARAELGLNVGRSFQRFHDTGGAPLAYNLSAVAPDSLTPFRWWFPVIGAIDYIGYFSKADAEAAEAELRRQGYDTALRTVDAYSSLGWFSDPVHSPLLERDDVNLVDTVVHELAHNTVYANGQSDFNESLATFIGRTGAQRYYAARGEEGRQLLAAAEERRADQEKINAWLRGLADALGKHYAQDIPRDEKIAGREAVFQAARDRFVKEIQPALRDPQRYQRWAQLPTNNATVLLNVRYNRSLDVFDKVYEKNNRDFAAFLAALRAAAGRPDPWAALEAAGAP